MKCKVFLFGESEKGEMCTPLSFKTLVALSEKLGNPPKDSFGIDYAVQTLLLEHELIFYRVREEGFSTQDYFRGIKLLYNQGVKLQLSAICLPGVGDKVILDAMIPICKKIHSILILSERDFYDYLTGSKY